MFKSFPLSFVIIVFLSGLIFLSVDGYAQNSRDIESRRSPVQLKDQNVKKKKLTRKQAKKQKERTYAAYFDRLVVEYEDRMENNVKQYDKLAKDLRKRQHRGPSYFGHKKPPKKRARGKKRKCKECQMWH